MVSSKKMTCKGTLRQVLIRVYRLEIESVMLVFIFTTQLGELLLSPLSLVQLSPLPPFPVRITKLSTRIQCVRGVWGSGPQTDKHLPQSPFTGQFFIWRHFASPSMSLSTLMPLSHSGFKLYWGRTFNNGQSGGGGGVGGSNISI